MHFVPFILFAAALIVCVIINISVIYALIAGLAVFVIFARKMGFSVADTGKMMLGGVLTAKNVILSLALIGILTALWRACGTIPVIITYSAGLIHAKTVIIMSFILNCGISMLTGTAFGTAATMGVISMTSGLALGADPVILGGAVISGAYFGDRASPMSTSALLVSELTQTNVFKNIRLMLRRSAVPFAVCCAVYAIAGIFLHDGTCIPDFAGIFSGEMALNWLCIIPAVIVIALSVLKLRVQITMIVSILSAAVLCAAVQHMSVEDILRTSLCGYSAGGAELSALLNGGGVTSMLKSMTIILISSTYAGIFDGTGMLDAVKSRIHALSRRIGVCGAVLVSAAGTSVISCNQTLAIMLTHELTCDTECGRQDLALDIEDTAVVLAPLVPWSIACSVPLDSIGAPAVSILAACFLYLLPIWSFITAKNRLSV